MVEEQVWSVFWLGSCPAPGGPGQHRDGEGGLPVRQGMTSYMHELIMHDVCLTCWRAALSQPGDRKVLGGRQVSLSW